jgi:response regulator RpfG family c-di-GMP phosphodiesterase
MVTEQTLSPITREGRPASRLAASRDVHKVAIVNGTTEVLAMIEGVLAAGHYDVVLVESVANAYSHIKRVQPDLVILCVRFDDVDAFHVLSMLKLDGDTRNIPVLTYTVAPEDEPEESAPDAGDIELFLPRPAALMN